MQFIVTLNRTAAEQCLRHEQEDKHKRHGECNGQYPKGPLPSKRSDDIAADHGRDVDRNDDGKVPDPGPNSALVHEKDVVDGQGARQREEATHAETLKRARAQKRAVGSGAAAPDAGQNHHQARHEVYDALAVDLGHGCAEVCADAERHDQSSVEERHLCQLDVKGRGDDAEGGYEEGTDYAGDAGSVDEGKKIELFAHWGQGKSVHLKVGILRDQCVATLVLVYLNTEGHCDESVGTVSVI